MIPFRIHTGTVAPLLRPNVDTDQIIPKQFLKRVERTGFGQFLFYDWRHTAAGELDPDFVLNARRESLTEGYALTVDLEQCEARDGDGLCFAFVIDESRRHCLLEGLDDIGLTLRHESNITGYESRRPRRREFQASPPTSS